MLVRLSATATRRQIAASANATAARARMGFMERDVVSFLSLSPQGIEGDERSESGEGRSQFQLKRMYPLTSTLSPLAGRGGTGAVLVTTSLSRRRRAADPTSA